MKARGVIVIDYEFPGGIKEAAAAQEKLEQAMNEIARGNNRVVYYQCDLKERRGDKRPDVTKMKFRTS